MNSNKEILIRNNSAHDKIRDVFRNIKTNAYNIWSILITDLIYLASVHFFFDLYFVLPPLLGITDNFLLT